MYRRVIQAHTDLAPEIVEAFMRLQYGTLDHLSDDDFAHECRIAEAAYAEAPELLIDNARSFGFVVTS